jgi:hypothetical protein
MAVQNGGAALVYRHWDPEGGVHADVQRGARLRVRPGRLGALSACHSKSVLYGGFVWAPRALNIPERQFPAQAATGREDISLQAGLLHMENP